MGLCDLLVKSAIILLPKHTSVLIIFYAMSATIAAFPPDFNTLKFVAVAYRHGDRYPGLLYANDPYANYSWPGGYGALSRKGALQMYGMGKHLRSRYIRLLPSDGFYTKENMRVLSSHPERCLMSAESLLAGLMPPVECENCLPEPWQPVAVNAIPADQDTTIFQFSASCPKYDAMINQFLTNPDPETDFYRYNQQLAPLYEYLTKYTGQDVTNVEQVFFLHDALLVEESNDLELPAWTIPVYPAMLLAVRARAIQLYTETPYMKRIRGGPLLTDVYQQMVQKRNGELGRNFAIYSGHESTLVNVMRALNVTDQATSTPDYGAMLALELHCDRGEECYVKIFYNFNAYNKMPKELTIATCTAPCSLSRFKNAINDVLITNFAQACEL